jgi:hypothetical protein
MDTARGRMLPVRGKSKTEGKFEIRSSKFEKDEWRMALDGHCGRNPWNF